MQVRIGANKAVYYVLPHLLPPRWKPRGQIHLPNISAEAGHTLVHFLYTGAYAASERSASHQLQLALSVYMAASSHDLPKLHQLAAERMAEASSPLDIAAMMESLRDDFANLAPESWVHKQLRSKITTAFERDCTAIKSDQLLAKADTAMTKFVIEIVIGLFQERLSQMLATERDLHQKLESATERLAVHELQSKSPRPEGSTSVARERTYPPNFAWSTSSRSSSDVWVSPVIEPEQWSGTTLAEGDVAAAWQHTLEDKHTTSALPQKECVKVEQTSLHRSVPTISVSNPLDHTQDVEHPNRTLARLKTG